MGFQTNDFQVATLELAEKLSEKVTVIGSKAAHTPPESDEAAIERAKLIRLIFQTLHTPIR